MLNSSPAVAGDAVCIDGHNGKVVMAYLITWVLLLSGFSMAVNHWSSAGDALFLKNQTHLPAGFGRSCGLRARSEPSTSGFSC